ncbi:SPOR domain-containing protein [Sulfitobacter sp. HNIBRBA3233]|uniref:SPOR domain-containing protein n=1 Tax=Sulfitobacter marinivivus TaxID=3158558 RepID=UPI0032DF8F07
MADFTQTPRGEYARHTHPEYAVSPARRLGRLTNFAGAAISLALVVGVGVWGYKLLVRDVSGIPVVRAAAGEMRVRPENPGGQFAEHQGLSVNSVAAIGTADTAADRLKLAPQPVDLDEEDQPIPQETTPVVTEAQADTDDSDSDEEAAFDVAAALESGNVDDLVAQLTNGVAPLEAQENAEEILAALSADDPVPAVLTGPGLRASLRPSIRPAGFSPARRAEPQTASAAAPAAGVEIDLASLPAGTRLVQLGAFDTPDIAREQWARLASRFAPFMAGKSRIVQEASSGGRTFYRLRAHGFEDIGDARRFCSALVAESVDCIPVVTR